MGNNANQKDKILLFEKRKKIYDMITKKPGFHLRELHRNLDLSFGALRYHLDYLKKRGLIITISDDGYSRYYISNNVGNGDKKYLCIFRQKTLRKILIIFLLCEDKHIFFHEDLKKLPKEKTWYDPENFRILKHRTTRNFHLKKLVDLKILKKINVKGKTGYELVDSENIWDFIIRYQSKLSNEEVDKLVKWTNNYIITNQMDSFIDTVWDVFPHPYHV